MIPWEDMNLVEPLVDRFDAISDELVRGLCSFHWVMNMKPRDELIQVLIRFPPGSTLPDLSGHSWCRRGKMCFTRTDSLRALAQLYIDHGFLSQNAADLFLADIPVLGEHDEQEATVTYQMLADPHCDMGNLVTTRINESLDYMISTFTPYQKRAFEWVQCQLDLNKPLQVAVVGPAGTGKSYLLKGLIQL